MPSAACVSAVKLQRLDKSLSSLESKRKKLTDIFLDDKITKEAYDVKYVERVVMLQHNFNKLR